MPLEKCKKQTEINAKREPYLAFVITMYLSMFVVTISVCKSNLNVKKKPPADPNRASRNFTKNTRDDPVL